MSPTDPSTSPAAAPDDALRAEHDALAQRLAVRRSIDEARKALYEVFFGLLAVGLTVKLSFDRWGPLKPGVVRKLHRGPPLFLWIAAVVAIVLLVLALRGLLRSRRLMREEDALFARYRAVRATLRLDP
jgi:hypothetical protein